MAGRLILKTILIPFLPVILFAGCIFVALAFLVGAVYSALPSGKILAGVSEDQEKDQALHQNYEKLCHKYNIADAWVVNERIVTPNSDSSYESSPENPYYPGRGVSLTGGLIDANGKDIPLALKWGQVHSATLFYAYVHELSEITPALQENVAKDLHPYFYYKKSQIISISYDDEGGSEYNYSEQYLLVEAYTIEGHYQYHYQWETITYPNGSVTLEVLKDTRQILPNRWQRLEDWVFEEYQLNSDQEELGLARLAVWEAGQGYSGQKEWLDWLINNNLEGAYVSIMTVPSDLILLFKEAEELYGIPWWFLAAVAFVESSFNPQAENASSKCYGLMQFTPANWAAYSVMLGFDPLLDRDNPRAQIIAGAYMLRELGLKYVDFDAADWQEQTLDVLTFYGGFRGANAQERCRNEYARKIWQHAENFRSPASIWPTPGYFIVSSPYRQLRTRDDGTKYNHGGIDIAAPTGATVVSASTGRVTFAGWQDPNNPRVGFGLYVVVRDQLKEYYYGHLSEISVRVGQEVQIGDQLGKVGNTGRSFGAHLHFEVRKGGIPDDPWLVLHMYR
jgi:hypothetical protein